MKTNLTLAVAITFMLAACVENFPSNPVSSQSSSADQPASAQTSTSTETKAAELDAKGVGKFTSIELSTPLNQAMVKSGNEISDLKCSACHKLTNEKVVGPGWKDVTKRRKPEWIMNFITNVDEMLNKDPNAMAMLEECLVRMPNQNLSDDDARAVLEFMRNNDGVK